ncbi:MAG TPA: 1-deoxy-D-xylulose-5-phosphate reductoisomerase [Thermoleophilia bacterium]|nr:1-deoxy-D-xylulose-5-phosphate reductoisomerase [Thermoleophilia bacterium]
MSAHADVDGLLQQAATFGVRLLALSDAAAAATARERLESRATARGRLEGRAAARERLDPTAVSLFTGAEGVEELIEVARTEAQAGGASLIVLNAVVGAAGLRATLATLRRGITLALANKESLVAGGEFVLAAARRSGARILPVDSEHSAIFQLLAGERPEAVEEIVLTGSGGPFRGRSRIELEQVTAADALRHPTWVMGPKITIDSATLMNKGLEIIEAHYLFDVPYERITVTIHPQSIVHSLVRFTDGALLAHLGVPDMRVPIGYALSYPARSELSMVERLDLTSRDLTFEPPDSDTFRCLALARQAGVAGGVAPAVLNAADEVAVHALLEGRIGFLDIAELVAEALGELAALPCATIDDVFAADAAARGFVLTKLGQPTD